MGEWVAKLYYDGRGVTMTLANGQIHVGNLENGVREGNGTLTSPDGTSLFSWSMFRNDKANGTGRTSFKNGLTVHRRV